MSLSKSQETIYNYYGLSSLREPKPALIGPTKHALQSKVLYDGDWGRAKVVYKSIACQSWGKEKKIKRKVD